MSTPSPQSASAGRDWAGPCGGAATRGEGSERVTIGLRHSNVTDTRRLLIPIFGGRLSVASEHSSEAGATGAGRGRARHVAAPDYTNAGSPDLSPSQRARFSPRRSPHSQEPTEAPLKWRKFLRLLLQAMHPGITMSSRLRRVGAKSLERTQAVRGILLKKGRQAPRRSGEPANGAASGHFRQAPRLRDTSLTAHAG
jgi:hypothetical protein